MRPETEEERDAFFGLWQAKVFDHILNAPAFFKWSVGITLANSTACIIQMISAEQRMKRG